MTGLAFAVIPTNNSLTHGIVGNTIYSWEKSGFLINNQPVYLANTQRLAENPQVVDLDGDGNLDLLVHTMDQVNVHRIYQELFNSGSFNLAAITYNSTTATTLKDFYQSKYPAAHIDVAKLQYDSVLGRVPVFKLSAVVIKKYGDLYHFSEDTIPPAVSLYEYVKIFSPNGNSFSNKSNCAYKFTDDHSSFAIDVYIEAINKSTGLPVYTEKVRSYTMVNTTLNYYWNGRTNAGVTANQGWYYLRVSGTDEAGNPVSNKAADFYVKTIPTELTGFTSTIVNTDYPKIVMKKTTSLIFNINSQPKAASIDAIDYQIKLTKQENQSFSYEINGEVQGTITTFNWDLKDDYKKVMEDGFYTAECRLFDDVGLISKPVTFNFEINREPIVATIEKNDNIFTPHNTDDTYPDVAEFTITLTDRGITVNEPYSYQILSPQNELIIQKANYSGNKIIWDGKDANGKFVADGLYTLKVRTVDNIGNAYEAVEKIIKTKIPVSIYSPGFEANGNNMLPIIGTVIDPGGTTFMDFEKFEILVKPGVQTDYSSTANWQSINPLPYYGSGTRTGYRAKLAFWQPTQNGVYTLLLKVKDTEGYVAFDTRVITANLTRIPVNVIKLSPAENTTFNINNDGFALPTHWYTSGFNNLFSYEVNVYAVSGDQKTKIIRNYSKAGNVPGPQTDVAWNGKDQWRKYVPSGKYIIEVYFYDLIENSLDKKEVKVYVNNYYDDPLVINRYEIINDQNLFVKISEPASCNISVYNGLNKVYEQNIVYSGSERELALPALPAGFYRVNLKATSLGNAEDIKEASLTLILNQELSKDGAELSLPTANIEPQHYFGFEADRTGVFYPEVTGTVKVKISGVREKYPYDPYTLSVVFKSSEWFLKYYQTQAICPGSDWGGDGWFSRRYFFANFIQDAYLRLEMDGLEIKKKEDIFFLGGWSLDFRGAGLVYGSAGGPYPVTRYVQYGPNRLQEGWQWIFQHSSATGFLGHPSYVDYRAFYKYNQDFYEQTNLYWKNVSDNLLVFMPTSNYQQMQNQLSQKFDEYFMLRGNKKNVFMTLQSKRPDYVKDVSESYKTWPQYTLWHYPGTTLHHEFTIMQQIEYDEEEFIKTKVLDQQKSFNNNYNYVSLNIKVDNFADPQIEPFEFEIDVPLKKLYKGHDFYSGNLGAYANEVMGGEKQCIQIPYRLVSGSVTTIKYLPVEMPISINTIVYSAEIISAIDSKINAQITHVSGYPQLTAKTNVELPWNSSMDANLKSGKLRGIVVYNPVNNSQIKLSDYYPKEAINRDSSMFLVENGVLKTNPQVHLTTSWNIALKEVKNITANHNALSLDNTYYLTGNPAGDYFTVKLNPNVYIDAYLPVYGWIADGYKESGYTLFIREGVTSNWQDDSTYLEYFPQAYKIKSPGNGYLLGFVKVSNYNTENVIRLVSSGTKGTSETLANITLGKKVVKGVKTRVYAYDYRSWLDIYQNSIVSPNTYYITLAPQKYDKDKMALPANMADPFGPIYSMRPHGLKFNPHNKPLLTSILNNTSTENVDLSRLVVYHLDSTNQLNIAPIYAITDSNNDGVLETNELGSLSSFVEGFSHQFYVPALKKLVFDKYIVYSGSEDVTLNAHGHPTGNIEGYLNGNYGSTVVDKTPDTPSGDYVINLNLTEGAHKFEAREYQIINSYKSVGPMSSPVNIIVDLNDPVLTVSTISNTVNQLYLEFNASEKANLHIFVSNNNFIYSAAKGFNQQLVMFDSLEDGIYEVTINLTDLSGRTSNIVTASILCDKTPPQGGIILSPTSGQNRPSLINLVYKVPTDNVSGLARFAVECSRNNQWETLATLNQTANSQNIYILAEDGSQVLRLMAGDKAGNVWYSPSVTFNLENNYVYKLDETKLTPIISANIHQVIGYTTTAGFCEAGTEILILKDPVNKTITANISSVNPVVYLVGRKFGQYTNVIPLPIKLPHFDRNIYQGEPLEINWAGSGTITYVTSGNSVMLYYQPLGSKLVYLSDTVTLKQRPVLSLNSVTSDQVLLYAVSSNNYLYKPVTGNTIFINYIVSIPATKSLTIYPYQDVSTRSIKINSTYCHLAELTAETITISALIENSNKINITFTKDTVCYPVKELVQTYSNSKNIITWTELQNDIAQYQAKLYYLDNLVQSITTKNNQLSFATLTRNAFYRFDLNSIDKLGNVSVTKSITFYSSPGKVFNVKPLNFTQFVEKAAGISFAIGTFAEEVLYAYQEFTPRVITGNIYLYQAFNLLAAKTIMINQPIDYYFDIRQLDQKFGGDINTYVLYYYKSNIWQAVPTTSYTYDPSLQRYHYTGTSFYPLAIGAKRFKKWMIDGVSPNYSDTKIDLDLRVYALNADGNVAAQASRLKVISANVQSIVNPICTNKNGYGVLPIRLNLGREITYNIQVADDTGVTGSISFYASQLPISFNALIVDGWLRVTKSVTLKEGTQYLMQIDTTTYPGASVNYGLSNYINMDLGAESQFFFRPDYKDAGTRKLNILVKNGGKSVQAYSITVNVLDTNRKPMVQDKVIVATENKNINGLINIIDYDNDAIQSIQILNAPANFNFGIIAAQALITYNITPNYDQQGTWNIPVRLYDGKDWATSNIKMFVKNVNRLPGRVNETTVNVLENQLLKYTIDIYDPDQNDTISLNFSQFPWPAGVISSQKIGGNITRFQVWIRPGFVDTNLKTYRVELSDFTDIVAFDQKFDIRPDTVPPNAVWSKPPTASTNVYGYSFYINVSDNVWSTINVKVYRDTDLLTENNFTTNNIVLAQTLAYGLNNFRFVFTDGVNNKKEITHSIKLENVAHIDPITGIYVELPVGAYNTLLPLLMATQNVPYLVSSNWEAGYLPYSIAQFSDKCFLSTFDSSKLLTPLNDLTSLNASVKYALKMPKLANNNQKINPVIWDSVNKKWLAHTAKRLTPEEFGPLLVPTAAFNINANEELIYFESPVLGLNSMMIFETSERPQVKLVNPDDYYAVGQNKILFTVKGNYLRLENTKMYLNGVTLNPRLVMDKYMDNFTTLSIQSAEVVQSSGNAVIEYDPSRSLFILTVDGFHQGDNSFRVDAENLVHQTSSYFILAVNSGELDVKEIYAYPNPARETGDQMIRFSCILSKPADINIRIYTNQGHLIKELNQDGQVGFNAVPWDGKDRYDNQVANGMYLYVITIDDGDKKVIQKKKVGILL